MGTACPGTGLDHSVFHIHEPFARPAFAPDRIVSGEGKGRRKDCRIIDNLIAVQDDAVSQVFPGNIER